MKLRSVDAVPQSSAMAGAFAKIEQAPQQFPFTEVWNSHCMFEQHGSKFRYVYELGIWLIWNNVRWPRDVDGEITRLAKSTIRTFYIAASDSDLSKTEASDLAAHAKSSETLRGLRAMIELAKSEPGITITQAMLDVDTMLIGTPTGTIDLRSGEAIEPDPAHLITKSTGVAFDPAATCPIWERVVREVFDEDAELVKYFQRLCGYCLTGCTNENTIVFAYGTGANGKSTLLTTMLSVLGDYAKQTPAETFMPKQPGAIRNDLAGLLKIRLSVSTETADGARLAEPLLKQASGGEPLSVRFLHKEYFEFIPEFKIIIATNHRPIIRGDDYAMWRRLHLLPFTKKIPPERQDKKLTEKLHGEREGILAWMVRGCLEWQQRRLDPPPAVLKATEAYRDDMDVFGRWLDECCVISADAKVQSGEAYESYKKWVASRGMKAMSQSPFSRKLEDRGFNKVKRSAIFFEGIGLQHVEGDGDALNF